METPILPLAGRRFTVRAYGSRGCAASHSRARRWASATWSGVMRVARAFQARIGDLGAGEVHLYNLPLFVLTHATAERLHQRLQRRGRCRFLLRRGRRTERHSGNGDRDKTCVVTGHNVCSLPLAGRTRYEKKRIAKSPVPACQSTHRRQVRRVIRVNEGSGCRLPPLQRLCQTHRSTPHVP